MFFVHFPLEKLLINFAMSAGGGGKYDAIKVSEEKAASCVNLKQKPQRKNVSISVIAICY